MIPFTHPATPNVLLAQRGEVHFPVRARWSAKTRWSNGLERGFRQPGFALWVTLILEESFTDLSSIVWTFSVGTLMRLAKGRHTRAENHHAPGVT